MNLALWIVQGLLAVLFAATGAAKAVWSKDRLLASGQSGVAPFPLPVLRLTGVCELLGALGLVLPRATGIAPALTPAAAIGLAVVLLGAMASHGSLLCADRAADRGSAEARNIAGNVLILALLLFVAVGRL
ncbi:DoxX family protein [Streptacidiphilus sp. PAMC 29251]